MGTTTVSAKDAGQSARRRRRGLLSGFLTPFMVWPPATA